MEKFSELKYERPNLEKVKGELEALLADFSAAKNYKAAKAAYMAAEKITGRLSTMLSLAHIRNTMDTQDEFYAAETAYLNVEVPKLNLLSRKRAELLIASPFRAQFEAELGQQIFRMAEMEKRTKSPEIIDLLVKQNELTTEYSRISAACKTVFRGEECNFYGLLKHMQSTNREERREAFHAWSKLLESISDELDALYDALIAIRVEIAKRLGYDNYTDLAYYMRGRFDYTPKDVAAFREQIKAVVTPACEKIFRQQAERLGVETLRYYDEALVFPEGNAIPHGTTEEKVDAARAMYAEMSPETHEFFDFMVEHELFDLETRPGKRLGGYCTSLADEKAPFIFSNFNGTSADVDVLTHEAGHAFECYLTMRSQPLEEYCFSTSEINEIHSMTMEHFAYPYMERFFGENTKKYLYAHLCQSLTVIPYMAAVDEFQHRIYEKPDMTARERRSVWHKLEEVYMPWRDYDDDAFLAEGAFWMQKQHIFLYPFYYIDYALAQMGAFEFYGRMKEDRKAAWKDYLALCRAGGSKGYFELLKVGNLKNPFAPGTVEAAVKAVEESIATGSF